MKDLKQIILKNTPLEEDDLQEKYAEYFPEGDITIKNIMDIANEAYQLGAKEHKDFFKNPNVRWW
jgi:hypothetical protein